MLERVDESVYEPIAATSSSMIYETRDEKGQREGYVEITSAEDRGGTAVNFLAVDGESQAGTQDEEKEIQKIDSVTQLQGISGVHKNKIIAGAETWEKSLGDSCSSILYDDTGYTHQIVGINIEFTSVPAEIEATKLKTGIGAVLEHDIDWMDNPLYNLILDLDKIVSTVSEYNGTQTVTYAAWDADTIGGKWAVIKYGVAPKASAQPPNLAEIHTGTLDRHIGDPL